jgi:hypothetical protein
MAASWVAAAWLLVGARPAGKERLGCPKQCVKDIGNGLFCSNPRPEDTKLGAWLLELLALSSCMPELEVAALGHSLGASA